jgi:hypothetical protein
LKKNITSKPIQYDKVWQTIILDTNGQSFKDRTCQNKYIFTKSKKKKTRSHPLTESSKWSTFWLKLIRVITKLPNPEQPYKGKVKTHKYINRQNQSTTGKL